MVSDESIRVLNISHPDLKKLIREFGEEKNVPKGIELLREGQFVKVIPFVVEGAIKVVSRYESKELLLYYIQPQESCVMSFISAYNSTPSEVFAMTDKDSRVVLLPTTLLQEWMLQYPSLSTLFFAQYTLRYQELLQSMRHFLFDPLDKRVIKYLRNKSTINQGEFVKVTHREIAADLATSREVVTRVLKKLEHEGRISQNELGFRLN
jgi:CRP/FNR family transcriptional regulator